LADHLLDQIDRSRRLFDAGTSPVANVHFECSGIDRWKEILSKEWIQETRSRRESQY
jgi:hypothetical protein